MGGSLRSILVFLCVAPDKYLRNLGQCNVSLNQRKAKGGISMAGHGVWGSFAFIIERSDYFIPTRI